MEVELEQYAGKYQIVALLGEGGQASVYLGVHQHNKFALKVYQAGANKQAACSKQVQILTKTNHENHIKMLDYYKEAPFKLTKKPIQQRPLIVLEFADGGDLFNYIAKTGKFSQELARTYLKQIITALHYLHSIGITHRDLKPENILLDKTFTLKISDFGLATPSIGRNGNYELRSCVGTSGYRAPEIYTGKYEGLPADMFSIGVILFVMYTRTVPFATANPNDRQYSLIKNRRYAQFWQYHENRNPNTAFPDSFKRLINIFLCADPSCRPSFEALENDQWLNGPCLSKQQLFQAMNNRAVELGIHLQQPNFQVLSNRQGVRIDFQLEESEVFLYYFNTVTLKRQALPQYELKDVVYVNKTPNFIVAWLHYFLTQQSQNSNSSLGHLIQQLKLLRYELKLNEDTAELQLKLIFEVEKDDETNLILKGFTHQSYRNEVGIRWTKQEGNFFWLSQILSKISSSIALLS